MCVCLSTLYRCSIFRSTLLWWNKRLCPISLHHCIHSKMVVSYDILLILPKRWFLLRLQTYWRSAECNRSCHRGRYKYTGLWAATQSSRWWVFRYKNYSQVAQRKLSIQTSTATLKLAHLVIYHRLRRRRANWNGLAGKWLSIHPESDQELSRQTNLCSWRRTSQLWLPCRD